MAGPVAVLDASVLYPAPLRDFLLRAAALPFAFYRPLWSSLIHDEWTRNLAANRPDLKPEQINRTRNLVETAFPAAMIAGHEPLIDALNLPDPDDRHVLAVAIHGHAKKIVTANLRHFPASYLAGFGIEPLHPDAFTVRLHQSAPFDFLEMVRQHRAKLNKPPKSAEEYVDDLRRNQMKHTADLLAKHTEDL